MPERTLPSRLLASSTRSSAAALVLALLCSGCGRREPARNGEVARGYIRLQALMEAHPGWQEVREMDAALSTPPPAPATRTLTPELGGIRPAPLSGTVGTVNRESPLVESKRIEAIREPAQARIDKLQRTSNLRSDRNIVRKQADVEKNTQASLAANELRLAQQETAEKATIRKEAHNEIRDFGLKEIAINSEIDSLKQFPGLVGTTRPDLQKKLDGVVAKRKAAEARLADKLKAADDKYKSLLASTAAKIEEAGREEVAAFKQSERIRVATEVAK